MSVRLSKQHALLVVNKQDDDHGDNHGGHGGDTEVLLEGRLDALLTKLDAQVQVSIQMMDAIKMELASIRSKKQGDGTSNAADAH